MTYTVYEKHNKPGGMMNQGIPVFRLPRDIINKEIAQIAALGVKIICNTTIGEDLTLASTGA
jgi:NADPH-dependent glutamate synthase beta subunit-like oxidoreductase